MEWATSQEIMQRIEGNHLCNVSFMFTFGNNKEKAPKTQNNFYTIQTP